MKKLFTFLAILSISNLFAQNKIDSLLNGEFISNIGYGCEETDEPDPCAGVEMYLILNFTKERVLITEKDVSSCGSEYITSKLEYNWELTQDSIIKIHSKPEEIEYNFLKNLVLKIEDGEIVGYKQYWNNKIEKFVFDKRK